MAFSLTFNLVLPIAHTNSFKNNKKFSDLISELKFFLRGDPFQTPPIPIQVEYFQDASDSALCSVLERYFGTEVPVYDMQGFSILRDHFECNEGYAYSAIELSGNIDLSEEFLQKYYNNIDLEEENSIWEIVDYRWECCPKTKQDVEYIHIPAHDIFSQMLYAIAGKFIAIMNLSKPGSISALCGFINRGFYSKEIESSAANIEAYKLSTIDYAANAFSSEFEEIDFHELWEWSHQIKGFSDGQESETSIGRALNLYCLLFQRRSIAENLLTTVAALETLYVEERFGKLKQLQENIPKLLPTSLLFPKQNFDQLIEFVYNERSRFIHGDKNIPNPFEEDFYQEELYKASCLAIEILMLSLRESFKKKLA